MSGHAARGTTGTRGRMRPGGSLITRPPGGPSPPEAATATGRTAPCAPAGSRCGSSTAWDRPGSGRPRGLRSAGRSSAGRTRCRPAQCAPGCSPQQRATDDGGHHLALQVEGRALGLAAHPFGGIAQHVVAAVRVGLLARHRVQRVLGLLRAPGVLPHLAVVALRELACATRAHSFEPKPVWRFCSFSQRARRLTQAPEAAHTRTRDSPTSTGRQDCRGEMKGTVQFRRRPSPGPCWWSGAFVRLTMTASVSTT